jgi:N-carbamoyl-L-amino-acid hydrolase
MKTSTTRLRNDLETNATYGSIETADGHGRTVPTGTPANREARDYFISRLEDAGLDVRIDRVGNVVGRWTPETADPDAAPIATGSHLDSVPEGGIFDGPLGVYGALEAVRALQDAEEPLNRPVDVVSFTGEEGSRFPPLVGSSVAAGARTANQALALTDDDGVTLEEALADIDYIGEETLNATEWDCWLELHIEQGRVLEREGFSAGVVSAITGIMQVNASFNGEANHAGSTPMPERRDALVAAAEFVQDVERSANDLLTESESLVGTVGKFDVKPGATNVVPGAVDAGIDIRDVDRATMDSMAEATHESLDRIATERDVETTAETIIDIDPVAMDDRCSEALRAGADKAGIEIGDLHSGAGHDTMHISAATDTGMLFAQSKDGISHSPAEWTAWQNCAQATSVLANAIATLGRSN